MDTKQWNTLMKESVTACDMTQVIQQADDWFRQGVDYWKAWSAFASSYTAPQAWLETAGGVSKTMENYMQDLARLYGMGQNSMLDEAIEAHRRLAQKTDEAMERIKKEKSTLKRTLTNKEKALKEQRSELIQHQKTLDSKEKEIQALQTKVKSQAERLILLEAAANKPAKPSPQPKSGATVAPSGK